MPRRRSDEFQSDWKTNLFDDPERDAEDDFAEGLTICGELEDLDRVCEECDGSGFIRYWDEEVDEDCHVCLGTGYTTRC